MKKLLITISVFLVLVLISCAALPMQRKRLKKTVPPRCEDTAGSYEYLFDQTGKYTGKDGSTYEAVVHYQLNPDRKFKYNNKRHKLYSANDIAMMAYSVASIWKEEFSHNDKDKVLMDWGLKSFHVIVVEDQEAQTYIWADEKVNSRLNGKMNLDKHLCFQTPVRSRFTYTVMPHRFIHGVPDTNIHEMMHMAIYMVTGLRDNKHENKLFWMKQGDKINKKSLQYKAIQRFKKLKNENH